MFDDCPLTTVSNRSPWYYRWLFNQHRSLYFQEEQILSPFKYIAAIFIVLSVFFIHRSIDILSANVFLFFSFFLL